MAQNRRIQVANNSGGRGGGLTLNDRFGALNENSGINKFGRGGQVSQTATFQLNRATGGGRGGARGGAISVNFVGERIRGGRGGALRNGSGRGGAFRVNGSGRGRGSGGRGRGRGGKPKRKLTEDEKLEKLDKEMDNYMNKDKEHGKAKLDEDIDEFMKASGKEESKNEGTSTAAVKT